LGIGVGRIDRWESLSGEGVVFTRIGRIGGLPGGRLARSGVLCLAGISVEGFGDLGAGIFEDIGSADEFRGDSGGPYPSAACRAVYPRTFWIS
jgi:hypothetical protein